MYQVLFTKTAERALIKLARSQPPIAHRIVTAIDRLGEDPTLGTRLRNELKGLWKYRVGSYRIIYQVRKHQLIVTIIDIGHRREVYR